MSKFHVRQIEGEIKRLFDGQIYLSDVTDDRKKDLCFLSRGLAAYSLQILADVTVEEAARSVVDGFDDNGIDAVYFDESQSVLWFIQSKWIQKGSGQPETGDMRKFKDGILDLMDEKFDRFNEKVKAKKNEVRSAIESRGLRIKAVLAYTGSDLSAHNRRIIDDLLSALNDYEEVASFELFNLENAFKALTDSINSNNIKVDFNLSNWGKVEEPYEAYYGQICASDVARWWREYRGKLFSKNIRDFIGNSEVNSEIARTIQEEPENFWYFNNGITVLCQEINRIGVGKDRKTGSFSCKGISVINGAQTIGSIGSIYEDNPEQVEEAEIFIKFISLENCPDDFGVRVTRATNTQNKVDSSDFVSLDPEQERLRRELQTCNKNYFYKRSNESHKGDPNSFTLVEATTALACANQNVELAILTKKEISQLWANTSKPPYKTIFNSSLTAEKLWRVVEVLRAADDSLKNKEKSAKSRDSSLYTHGDRFILHIVFQKIAVSCWSADDSEFDAFRRKVLPSILDESSVLVRNCVDENYPDARLAMLFKSLKKCKELKLMLAT